MRVSHTLCQTSHSPQYDAKRLCAVHVCDDVDDDDVDACCVLRPHPVHTIAVALGVCCHVPDLRGLDDEDAVFF